MIPLKSTTPALSGALSPALESVVVLTILCGFYFDTYTSEGREHSLIT